MAIPSNAYTQYESIGIREDLIDVITNIDPVDTWFTSNSGNTTATQKYHEWQTDVLDTPGANAVIEGDTMSATAITPTARTGNYCQILRKSFMVTDSADIATKAGRSTELSYQTQNKLKALARDIEYCLIVTASSAAGASGTARQSKGLFGWIATNTASGQGSAAGEAQFNTVLQTIWAAGGKPSTALCGGQVKRAISAWTTNTRYTVAEEKRLTSAVDVYQSDFGAVAIRGHLIIEGLAASGGGKGHIAILGDMGLWKKAWYRKPKAERAARSGPYTTVWIEAELCLEARQEKGSGLIKGCLAS